MSKKDIISIIDNEFESKHLPKIREFLRQPSVSATGEGILTTANMLVDKIERLGGKNVHLVEHKEGHPQVYGELIVDEKKPTICFYSMYDVQPVYPEKWVINDDKKINPFGGEIHKFEWFNGYSGECLINRGITNQKGPTMGFFNVLETIKKETNTLPVNILFAIEGEEELGSKHMKLFLKSYSDKLKKADAVYFPMFFESEMGDIRFFLGVRGVIETKIKCKGGSWGGPNARNVHSSSSGLVESPVFKLIEALNSLKNDKTNEILVPGIMDDPKIVGPDEEDKKVISELLKLTDFAIMKKVTGVDKFRNNKDGVELTGEEAMIEFMFKPGLSINGIESGYYGEGGMTIIPFEAKANLDIRLPPFQEIEYVKDCYRKFLESNFPMLEVELGAGYGPAKMSPSHPLIQLTKQTYLESNKTPLMYPLLPGSAPFSMFQSILGLPFVYGGLGHGGRVHSPLEYAVIKSDDPKVGGIIDFEKFVVRLLYNFEKGLI